MRGRQQNRWRGTKHSWAGNETSKTTLGASRKLRLEARYNSRTAADYRYILDFAVLHYATAKVSSRSYQLFDHMLKFQLPREMPSFRNELCAAIPKAIQSFKSCSFAARFKSLGLCHHLRHRRPDGDIANVWGRPVQGLSSITRLLIALFDTLSGPCVPSYCRTRRPQRGTFGTLAGRCLNGDFEITCGQVRIPRTLRMYNKSDYRYRIVRYLLVGFDWRLGRLLQ